MSTSFALGFGSAVLTEQLAAFSLKNTGDNFAKLHQTFLNVEVLLDDMENHPLRFSDDDGSRPWRRWYEDLREATYDTKIFLDKVAIDLCRCSISEPIYFSQLGENRNSFPGSFDLVVSPGKLPFIEEFRVPFQIDTLQKRLDRIIEESKYLLETEKIKKLVGEYNDRCLRSSFYYVVVTDAFGRLGDTQRITRLLSGDHDNLLVIPIVGMCGIGKSTLAHIVYSDTTVIRQFDTRVWVSVSRDFNLIKIMRSIIEYTTNQVCALSDFSSVCEVVQHLLSEKKLLLVLDDYWDEEPEDWDILYSVLRCSSKGSVVIITTRSLKISSIVSSFEPYKLNTLSTDDCWHLIKQRSFTGMEFSDRMEQIGREMASKCEGLPLVATHYGHMLRCKLTEEEWQSVVEKSLWGMSESSKIFHAIFGSYQQLSPPLKKCYVYSSILPLDHEFDVKDLIQLWVAEGLIRPRSGKRMEDIGLQYFQDLCSAFIFQKCERSSRYKMPPLVHEMGKLISGHLFSSGSTFSSRLFGDGYHLCLINDSGSFTLKASQKKREIANSVGGESVSTSHDIY